MARIGYARVSTRDQDAALQRDALAAAGCAPIFEDQASGARAERPGLADALAFLRDGDVLVVWKLDRLGRSLSHLIETVADLEARGVGFQSITEAIDTTTSSGRLTFHLFGALGQFERDLIRERTRAGLAAAAARGPRTKGRTSTRPQRRQGPARARPHRQGPHRPGSRRAPENWKEHPLRRHQAERRTRRSSTRNLKALRVPLTLHGRSAPVNRIAPRRRS